MPLTGSDSEIASTGKTGIWNGTLGSYDFVTPGVGAGDWDPGAIPFGHATDGSLIEDPTNFVFDNATNQLRLAGTGAAAGILIGGDTNLYRSQADVLRTDDAFWALNFAALVASASDVGYSATQSGDANFRFQIRGSGEVRWGGRDRYAGRQPPASRSQPSRLERRRPVPGRLEDLPGHRRRRSTDRRRTLCWDRRAKRRERSRW